MDGLTIQLDSANAIIKDLEEKLENAEAKITKIEETNKQLQYEWKDFKTQRDLAVDEKEALMQMVERRNSEMLNLKSDLSELTAQLQSAVKGKLVALENAQEVESLKISLAYK